MSVPDQPHDRSSEGSGQSSGRASEPIPGGGAEPPRRGFLRQLSGERPQPGSDQQRAGRGTATGGADPSDAAALAAAAGIGFGDIVVLDSAVPTANSERGPGVGAYRSPYRVESDALIVLDQRRFPGSVLEVPCLSASDAAQAIRDGLSQGSGTVAAVGSYGLASASSVRTRGVVSSSEAELAAIEADAATLAAAAPWIVALRRALEAQLATARRAAAAGAGPVALADGLRHDADVMTMDEVLGLSRLIANGISLLRDHAGARGDTNVPLRALVHGPVGALAFGQLGSAVAAIQGAVALGIPVYAWIDEARPGMSGVRTAWEMGRAGVGYWLIPDSAVGGVLASSVDLVLTGALGVTASGTVVDEPGAYAIAALAQRHGVPVYVCAPLSTLFADATVSPAPRYDVVPAELIAGFITEAGVLKPPFGEALARVAPQGAATRQNHPS